jgi:hypothetical protein
MPPARKRILGLVFLGFCLIYLYAAVLGVPMGQKSDRERDKNEAKTDWEISSMNQRTSQRQLARLQSQILQLQNMQYDLVAAIATNTASPLSLRDSIIDADRKMRIISTQSDDLEAWEEGIKRNLMDRRSAMEIQEEKNAAAMHDWTLKRVQTEYQNASPIWDCTVNTLIEMMKKEALLKGDRVASNYRGLPRVRNSFEDTNFDLAEIKLMTNTNWDFKITMHLSANPSPVLGQEIGLGEGIEIDGKYGHIKASVQSGGDMGVYFDVNLNGTAPYRIRVKGDVKKPIDDIVGDLIATTVSQDDQSLKPGK